MSQVSSIRTLEEILRKAVQKGAPTHAFGNVITEAMGLNNEPQNMMLFFEIVSRAEKDVRKLQNVDHLEEDIQAIVELQSYFITQFQWGKKWETFKIYIQQRGIIRSLKSWAKDYAAQVSEVYIENEFLNELRLSLEEQLTEISKSDLTWRTKDLLTQKVREVLVAVEDCLLYGTRNLKVTTRSTLWEFERTLEQIPKEDKSQPVWKKLFSTLVAVDVVLGLWTNTENFLIPKLQSFDSQCSQIIQALTIETDSDKSFNFPENYDIPRLAGNSVLRLPPARDEEEE